MTQNREISFGYDPDPSRSSSLLSSAYTDHQWYDADLKASGKTHVYIVLKQRGNSRNYGLVCNLGKQMAEEVGFEPTERVNVRWFSRPVHSTTLPLLQSILQ